MALELIKISEFPQVTEPGEWIPVSGADGVAYKMHQDDFKAWLGTVQTISPREISPTDPEPGLDGLYIPTEDGTYTNAGGLVVDRSEGGADYGQYIQFINDGGSWSKVSTPMPAAENKIQDWTAGTYVQGDQRIHNGQIWMVNIPSTSEEPVMGGDWVPVTYIGRNSVEPQKTSFAELGKNKFDKSDILEDSIIDAGTGAITSDPAWATSYFIPVTPNTDYKRSHNTVLVWYDEEYSYISGEFANTIPITSPNNAMYARVSVRYIDIDAFQLEIGTETTDYEDYGAIVIPRLKLPDSIVNPIITPERTTFVRESKNLFNKDNVSENVLLDSNTGETSNNSAWVTTAYFMPIIPNTDYKRSHNTVLVWYDEDKTFISGNPANTIVVTSPGNAAFAKVSVRKIEMDAYQFEQGTETTNYEGFFNAYPDGLIIRGEDMSPEFQAEIDDQISEAVSLSDVAIKSERAGRELPEVSKYPSAIMELIKGNDDTDKFIITASSAISDINFSEDTVNYWKNKSFGYRMEMEGNGTGRMVCDAVTPISIPPTAVVAIAVYVPEPEKITNIVTELYMNPELSPVWSRNKTSGIKKGWNIIRHHVIPYGAGYGLEILDPWGTEVHRIRLMGVFTDESYITIGSVWLECPEKAQLLFVDDGGYDTFLQIGYPQLKARGIPTTWALNPGILGQGARISEADVDMLSMDIDSSFSFHSWASEATAEMTPKEFAEDATRCVRWLRKKGLVGNSVWRAAVVQNLAANHQAQRGIVEASRTYDAKYGFDTFPFLDRWNIPRNQLHGALNIDDFFEMMKRTHSLAVVYTHGIVDGSIYDVTPAKWAEFIDKIDEALSEGWLEGVTYESLNNKMVTDENPEYFKALQNESRRES